MTEERLHLEQYNPARQAKFLAEKKLIEQILGVWISGSIEHVGSTAVPGLPAKPIIDIMVGVKNLAEAKACIPLLEKIGYHYAPYRTDRMHWFCKPSQERREYHLYLIEATHPEWKARIAFRDYLREHPETAKQYTELKTNLAKQYENDREAYTEGKAAFVKSIVDKALGA